MEMCVSDCIRINEKTAQPHTFSVMRSQDACNFCYLLMKFLVSGWFKVVGNPNYVKIGRNDINIIVDNFINFVSTTLLLTLDPHVY